MQSSWDWARLETWAAGACSSTDAPNRNSEAGKPPIFVGKRAPQEASKRVTDVAIDPFEAD